MLSSLTALIGPVSNLLDQFVEDKDKKNALVHEIATLADKHHQELMLAQSLSIEKRPKAIGFSHLGGQPLHGFVWQG